MLNASESRLATLLPGLGLPTLLLLFTAAGCSQMGGAPGGQQTAAVTLSPEQQQAIAMQTQQYQQRAAALDRDNQELQSLLAQSKQQAQLMEEQVRATQTQLRDTTNQLAALQSDNEQMRSRTTAMAASIRTQSQAEIRSNNSLLRNLTITNLPGVQVRQDGDVIRVEIPSDQLFNPGTAQLKYGAEEMLRSVGADLAAQLSAADDRHRRPHRQHDGLRPAGRQRPASLGRPSRRRSTTRWCEPPACRPISCSSSATGRTTRWYRTPPTPAGPATGGSNW